MQKHGAASCIIREISDKLGKPKELVAVFFMETTGDMAFSGSMGGAVCPSVQLCAGGVSPGAVLDSCMAGIAAGFQHSGICPAKAVRIYSVTKNSNRNRLFAASVRLLFDIIHSSIAAQNDDTVNKEKMGSSGYKLSAFVCSCDSTSDFRN